MNQETQLKIQAYVDGELSSTESRQVEAWLADDPNALQLSQELVFTKKLMAGNEKEYRLPESREFFWSKIQREIEPRADRPLTVRERVVGWLRLNGARWLAPAASAALVLSLLFLWLPSGSDSSGNTAQSGHTGPLEEIEVPLAEVSTIAFHSQQAGMTVVWVQTNQK
jgi:anti-sigma factor RsiW